MHTHTQQRSVLLARSTRAARAVVGTQACRTARLIRKRSLVPSHTRAAAPAASRRRRTGRSAAAASRPRGTRPAHPGSCAAHALRRRSSTPVRHDCALQPQRPLCVRSHASHRAVMSSRLSPWVSRAVTEGRPARFCSSRASVSSEQNGSTCGCSGCGGRADTCSRGAAVCLHRWPPTRPHTPQRGAHAA